VQLGSYQNIIRLFTCECRVCVSGSTSAWYRWCIICVVFIREDLHMIPTRFLIRCLLGFHAMWCIICMWFITQTVWSFLWSDPISHRTRSTTLPANTQIEFRHSICVFICSRMLACELCLKIHLRGFVHSCSRTCWLTASQTTKTQVTYDIPGYPI